LLDRFGGWSGITSRATGFFRVEEVDGRWWFIDPDGNAFISLGINHVQASLLRFPWNKHVWERKYGTVEKFYTKAREEILSWGFNTFGKYGYLHGLPYSKMIRFAPISGYMAGANFREESLRLPRELFVDVFSKSWEKECRIRAEVCRSLADDWLLMGYWVGDVPVWDEGKYWIEEIVKMEGAGAQRLIEYLRNRYDDNIREFNKVYGTKISSFDDVLQIYPLDEKKIKNLDRVYDDEDGFMRLVARRYYEVTIKSIRRFDRNHMIFGDSYDMNTVGDLIRGRQIPDFVLEEAKPHVDVLGLQGYQLEPMDVHLGNIIRWQKIIQKPVILTDSSYPTPPTPEMPNPFGPRMSSQKERIERYKRYFNAIFSMPFVIGWWWCGYIDQRRQPDHPLQKDRQHSGLKSEFDEPYTEVIDVIKEHNRKVYEIASRAKKDSWKQPGRKEV